MKNKFLQCLSFILELVIAFSVGYLIYWKVTNERPSIETCIIAIIGVLNVQFIIGIFNYFKNKMKHK